MPARRLSWIIVWILLIVPGIAAADPCPPTLRQAMTEAGLTEVQIRIICERAAELQGDRRPVITPAQVERDIAGKILGTWIFQKSEWRDIDILEADYVTDKARLVVNVDTIRNKTGRLRLRYRWVDGRWKIYRLFNIDFE